MKEPDYFNVMFDPKKAHGVVSKHYPAALADAVVAAAQLQANLSANDRNSEVVFWGDTNDILANTDSMTPDRSFRNKLLEVESSSGNIAHSKRTDLPELLSIDFNNLYTQSDIQDSEGRTIEGLSKHILPITYYHNGETSSTEVALHQNKDLYALSSHAQKHGLINADEKTTLDFLTDMIDPDSASYLPNVGMINDIKKPMILLLEQKIFEGGSHYLDIDRAMRLKEFDSSKYTAPTQAGLSRPGLFNIDGEEIDALFMRKNHTDTSQLLNVVNTYHTHLKPSDDMKDCSSMVVPDTMVNMAYQLSYLNKEKMWMCKAPFVRNIEENVETRFFTGEFLDQKPQTWKAGNKEYLQKDSQTRGGCTIL